MGVSSLFSKAKPVLVSYFFVSGIFFSISLCVIFLYGLYKLNALDVTSEDVINKSIEKIAPKALWAADILKSVTRKTDEGQVFTEFDIDAWINRKRTDLGGNENRYETESPPIIVSTSNAFLHAFNSAESGDVIQLVPGIYRIHQQSIRMRNSGTYLNPIRVIGDQAGKVLIELDTLEGFYVDKPFWHFENLNIKGVCSEDSQCEHAFHIVGKAIGVVIKNNKVFDFNAMIKANGVKRGGNYYYPDSGVIEGNVFYNQTVRNTGNPVTLLDMVGVNDWVVSGNLIADFMKAKSNRISYGAFFKGNGSWNVFERNLVICRLNLSLDDRTQVGLSFGGGATITSGCRDQQCEVEHTGGIIRHNVIMNCDDVAVYLNKAKDTQIYNNTLINTLGIDVRFSESSAIVANNFLTGRVKDRNNGFSQRMNNVVVDLGDLNDFYLNPLKGDFTLVDSEHIVDQGRGLQKKEYDFCGQLRQKAYVDIGAFEFSDADKRCYPFQM